MGGVGKHRGLAFLFPYFPQVIHRQQFPSPWLGEPGTAEPIVTHDSLYFPKHAKSVKCNAAIVFTVASQHKKRCKKH